MGHFLNWKLTEIKSFNSPIFVQKRLTDVKKGRITLLKSQKL